MESDYKGILDKIFKPLLIESKITIEYEIIHDSSNKEYCDYDCNIISVNNQSTTKDFNENLEDILSDIFSQIKEYLSSLSTSQQKILIYKAIKYLDKFSGIVKYIEKLPEPRPSVSEGFDDIHFFTHPEFSPHSPDLPMISNIIIFDVSDFAKSWHSKLQEYILHLIYFKNDLFFSEYSNFNKYSFKSIKNTEDSVTKYDLLNKYCYCLLFDYDIHEPVLWYFTLLNKMIEELKSEIFHNLSDLTDSKDKSKYLNDIKKEIKAIETIDNKDKAFSFLLNFIKSVLKNQNTISPTPDSFSPIFLNLNTYIKQSVKIKPNDIRYSFCNFFKTKAKKDILDFIEEQINPIVYPPIFSDISELKSLINKALFQYNEFIKEEIWVIDNLNLNKTFSDLFSEIRIPTNYTTDNIQLLHSYYSDIYKILLLISESDNLIVRRHYLINILFELFSIIIKLESFFYDNKIQISDFQNNITRSDFTIPDYQTVISNKKDNKKGNARVPEYNDFVSMFTDTSFPEKVIEALIEHETLNKSGELIKDFYEVVAFTEALIILAIIKRDVNQTTRNTLFGNKIKAKFADKTTRTKNKEHLELVTEYKDVFSSIKAD